MHCARHDEMDLLTKVNALEAEKQGLADNVQSLQRMLSTMQQQFSAMGEGNQSRWGPLPDEYQP
jgi:uncharacterized protein YlxW (UPF0749 family)